MAADDDADVYFFVHVMKTGGTSFIYYMQEVIGKERIYPVREAGDSTADLIRKRTRLSELRALTPGQRATLRAYSGHFPAFAAELVGATKTMTVLRDPVKRAISMLKQRQRRWAPDKSLVELYEDPVVFNRFVDNHQTRIFALDPSDDPASFMADVRLDRARLDAAKERLASIDVVGVQERYGQFLEAVQHEFGWPPQSRRWAANVGAKVEIPDGLAERIAEDMA